MHVGHVQNCYVAFLSLHSKEFVKFGTYNILLTRLSCGLSCYLGVYECYANV